MHLSQEQTIVLQVLTTNSKECPHSLETWMPGVPLKGQQQMALVSACRGIDNFAWHADAVACSTRNILANPCLHSFRDA